MKTLWVKLTGWIRDLKLHWKIQLMMLLVLFCSVLLSVFIYNYNWKAYETQLYAEVAGNLVWTTQNLETEMKKLQDAVSSVATSKDFQAMIRNVEQVDDSYERYARRRRIISYIAGSIDSLTYVLSTHYVAPDMLSISTGADTSIHTQNTYQGCIRLR